MERLQAAILLTWALLPAAGGCTHEPKPGESIDEVCRPENNGKELTVSGYLVPPDIVMPCKESCVMYIARNSREREGVWATFPVGDGRNQMAAIVFDTRKGRPFPGEVRRLSSRDFRIKDDSAKVSTAGDVVRVTGKVLVYKREDKIDCSMQVKRVQAL